ncbi:hypothetical protein OMR07_01665, partial [Methylobacterium organophilum]|nr:hypothetical protein [Methylobacterium organophilum]
MATELAPGLMHHPGFLDATARARLASEIAAILAEAPPVTPRMPRTGKPFSVRMSNAGVLAGLPPLDVPVTDDALTAFAAADGVLDFTAPAATVAFAE